MSLATANSNMMWLGNEFLVGRQIVVIKMGSYKYRDRRGNL